MYGGIKIVVNGVPIQIVGCGRWSMLDDRLGLVAAERLGNRGLPGCQVQAMESPGGDLVAGLDDPVELLVVIDASPCDERHPAGTFERMEYRRDRDALQATRRKSCTHSLSLLAALDTADAMNVLPKTVWIYLIFGERFERGFDISDAAVSGLHAAVSRVETDVRRWLVERGQ